MNHGQVLLQEPVEELAERALRITGPTDAMKTIDRSVYKIISEDSFLSESNVGIF